MHIIGNLLWWLFGGLEAAIGYTDCADGVFTHVMVKRFSFSLARLSRRLSERIN